jgi:hypothetical protein
VGKLSQSYLKELAEKKKYKSGGFSTEGYKRNSPDVNNPYNVIPSNRITMKGVDFPIMGIDDMGYQQMMYPGNDYTFPGSYVTEFPLKNIGNKRFGQKGFYKPDFRSKSQIANEQGTASGSTTVAPKMNPIAIRLIDEANAEKLKNQQPAFKQGYSKTASDIERSDYYRKQKELRDALKNLDVVTDIMQVGNFIPHPIAQGIGQVGNWLGAATDVTQAGMDYGNENYGGMGINLASAIVPTALGSASFRRNSKYLRPGQVLYPFSPQGLNPKLGINAARTDYLEPFNMVKRMTKNNLMANRALLGTLGVETAYDAGAFNNNTRLGLPINIQKPNYAMGGTMGIPGVNGQVVSSGPQPLTSVRRTRGPINKTKKGDVKTMSSKQVKQTLKYSKQKPNKL